MVKIEKKFVAFSLIAVILGWNFGSFLGCNKDSNNNNNNGKQICNYDELIEVLNQAQPGQTVKIGNCRITGSFTIPSGVILEGVDKNASILVSEGDHPVLKITPSTDQSNLTEVTKISIESNGLAGILCKGEGNVQIKDVKITSSRGIAIGAEELTSLNLSDIILDGPITQENANNFPPNITAADIATHGLVLVRVSNASLTNVSVSGFATYGALLVDSDTQWEGGGASGNMGTGVLVHKGHAFFKNLGICQTIQGLKLIPSYAGVFVNGATIETDNVEVCDGDGFGFLHDSVTANHANLKVRNNGDAGLWVQKSPSFQISGNGTEIKSNRFAGVVLFEVGDTVIQDAKMDENIITTRVFEETGSIDVGDGIQIVKPAGHVTLQNLSMSNNERVGILLDLGGGSFDNVTIEGVSVEGTGNQYGAIAQNGQIPDSWDSGVTRRGNVSVNDESFMGTLSIVGTVPSKSIPSANDVETNGFGAIVGDTG